MTQTLIGIGWLLLEGVAHPCRYHVDVDQIRGTTRGAGFLIGSTALLESARSASTCILRLEDGRTCRVAVTSYHAGNMDAAITLAGDLVTVDTLGGYGDPALQ